MKNLKKEEDGAAMCIGGRLSLENKANGLLNSTHKQVTMEEGRRNLPFQNCSQMCDFGYEKYEAVVTFESQL